MIGPAQVRAARALLDWSPAELAKRAPVAEDLLAAFEGGERALSPSDLTAIKRALEVAGVEFADEDGVRLKPKAISIPVEQLTTDNDE